MKKWPLLTQKPIAAPMSAALNENPDIVLQNHYVNFTDPDSTEVNEQYLQFYAEVKLSTTEGTQRSLIFFPAMQSLLSCDRFQPSEYVDTSHNSLIKGLLGQAKKLVERN